MGSGFRAHRRRCAPRRGVGVGVIVQCPSSGPAARPRCWASGRHVPWAHRRRVWHQRGHPLEAGWVGAACKWSG